MTDRPPVVTRFAPSPTGHLHIGGARTALFCWAYARRHGGSFILRVEDTDQARSSDDAAAGILADLAWLGIDWDEGPDFDAGDRAVGGDPRGVGPFHQARRLDLYHQVFEELIARGLAYPSFDTEEDLAGARDEAKAQKRTFRYTMPEGYDLKRAIDRMAAGEPHVLRLRVPEETITVRDAVLGDVVFEPEHIDDFVIRKRDGFPTYHFAVVVDDERMGVTHVLRGQEHLNNTPRHIALQRALGYRTPEYAHLPLIFNPDGSKMSKRDKDKAVRAAVRDAGLSVPPIAEVSPGQFDAWLGDKTTQLPQGPLVALAQHLALALPEIDVEDFRRAGYLPATVCNYLALLGWNPGVKNPDGTDLERFDMGYLAEHFNLERLGKTASKFDRAKLAAFSAADLQQMEPGAFQRAFVAWAAHARPDLLERLGERVALACRAAQPRVQTLRDVEGVIAFALVEDEGVAFDPKAVDKVLRKEGALALLGDLAGVVEGVEPWSPEAIESAVSGFCEGRGLGMGKAAQPLRVAITGGTISPGLGETLALVGRAGALVRIRRCVAVNA